MKPKKVGYKQIAELKEYFGWDDKTIKLIKRERGLAVTYKIMLAEKENEEVSNNIC